MKNITMNILLTFLFSALCFIAWGKENPDTLKREDVIVIPASDFLRDLPKGDMMTDAPALKEKWVFNNTALVLNSPTNLFKKVQVPEKGNYHLFVRSKGAKRSSFKIAVNDTVTAGVFGGDSLGLRYGGTFYLEAGNNDIKVTRIIPGAVVDVIVLTKMKDLREADLIPLQLNNDVTLLKEYRIPSSNAVKFGDVDGDGKTDFMVLSADFSATVFNNNGVQLWSWKAPDSGARQRSEFEAPGILWDFDRDGKAEAVQWRFADNKEWLVVADGQTGKVIRQTAWPVKPLPHEYNNFRLAIGKLSREDAYHIISFTDMGGTINISAFTSGLQQLWSHDEHRKKDNLGHYVYPVDLDKDGIDEVLVGSMLLNAKGQPVWNRFNLLPDNHDHADSYKFGDVDHDGQLDIVTANSEAGIFIYKALTGEIIWENVAEHTQQIQVGNFLQNVPGPHIVAGGRTYGNRQLNEPYLWSQLYWFDNKGNFLFKWPGNPINGNPDFVKGDWRGNGKDELFWYKFRINNSGQGEFYFPDPVFHLFDFMGKGAEEVITLNRDVLRVYGCSTARYTNKDRKKDLHYRKSVVVNHTHY